MLSHLKNICSPKHSRRQLQNASSSSSFRIQYLFSHCGRAVQQLQQRATTIQTVFKHIFHGSTSNHNTLRNIIIFCVWMCVGRAREGGEWRPTNSEWKFIGNFSFRLSHTPSTSDLCSSGPQRPTHMANITCNSLTMPCNLVLFSCVCGSSWYEIMNK